MKKITIISGAIIVIVGIWLLTRSNSENESQGTSDNLTPISNISHGHGLAVDVIDPSKVYIATHYGLLMLKDDKDLYQVGKSKDDYMGFSAHPTDARIFFASGHPSGGGNSGFLKSEDGGQSWKKVSSGISGPVDFHAMTVSSANPNLVFGWYKGSLQRSTDEGRTWEALPISFPITALATDPKDENIVYAATPSGNGIMVSKDKGANWNQLSEQLKGLVAAVAVHPWKPEILLASTEQLGLAKSSDAGKTWQSLNAQLDGEALFIAYSRQNSSIVYVLTHNNSLYKSSDEGNAWSKIR